MYVWIGWCNFLIVCLESVIVGIKGYILNSIVFYEGCIVGGINIYLIWRVVVDVYIYYVGDFVDDCFDVVWIRGCFKVILVIGMKFCV